MTDPTTSELRRLLAEATPPFPWRAPASGDILTSGREWVVASVHGHDPYSPARLSIAEDDANAALIVAAVNGLPALLDDLDALRAIVKRTSRMGLCSQTHHEHLMYAARAALEAEG